MVMLDTQSSAVVVILVSFMYLATNDILPQFVVVVVQSCNITLPFYDWCECTWHHDTFLVQ